MVAKAYQMVTEEVRMDSVMVGRTSSAATGSTSHDSHEGGVICELQELDGLMAGGAGRRAEEKGHSLGDKQC